MTELLLQTAKLIPTSIRLHPTAGSALVYCKEDEDRDSSLGSLLIVIEILGPTKKAEGLIDFIVHTAETNYFLPDKEAEGFEKRFEKTVRQLNISLSEQMELKQWPGKISAVVAALKNDSLVLTSTGSAEAYIFRGQKNTNITAGLDEQSKSPHLFNNVARGSVAIGDQIALVTPALLHQISQTELKSIVGNLTPASAVAKLAQLIENQPNTSRTAALVAAVTTPQLMAMNIRTGEPSEVTVAQAMTLPDLSPAMGKANRVVSRIGKVGWNGLQYHLTPFAKRAAQSGIARLRSVKNPLAKPIISLIVTVTVLIAGMGIASITSAQNLTKLQTQYETAYNLLKSADGNIQSQKKLEASNQLTESKKLLEGLASSSQKSALEKRLQDANRPSDDPASVAGLLDVVTAKQDQLDNITRLNTTMIHQFSSDKVNKSPKYIELLGSTLVAVSESSAQITLLDLAGKIIATNEGNKDVGKITGITPNASDDGVFITTDQPTLWLYKVSDNSLTKQDVSLGSLVKGTAVGSYNGNIYILSETGVFKHTPTLSGFSVPTLSIKAATTPSMNGSTTLAIDGSIYIGGGSNKIGRYVAGALTHEATGLPDSFNKPKQIHVIDDDSIYVVSNDTSRIAILAVSDKSLVYKRQVSLRNSAKFEATAYSNGILFSLSSGKLYKAQAKL